MDRAWQFATHFPFYMQGLTAGTTAHNGPFAPQMQCSFLKYIQYSCEAALFCGTKILVVDSGPGGAALHECVEWNYFSGMN